MLNLNVGSAADIDSRSCIVTRAGQAGHAVYGPYDFLEPGKYIVEFHLKLADQQIEKSDFLCAIIDVVHNGGNSAVGRKEIYFSQLSTGRNSYSIEFTVDKSSRFEYRVWVNGSTSLIIDDYRRIMSIPNGQNDLESLLIQNKFPEVDSVDIPFFHENVETLKSLYYRGVCVNIIRESVVLTVNGVSLFARSQDDIRFIGEVFYEGAYNFSVGRDVCVIDIGMNIGLSSLQFAQRAEVREVHSFEPFRNTFDRAIDNVSLNPGLAEKINACNFGLSDHDEDGSIIVDQHADSGAMSTVGASAGTPMHVSLKDAGTVLAPIVEAARAKGRAIIMKVDCEGSEFAVFRSLDRSGLLPHLAAFMVEWHAMFDNQNQQDLIAPLRANGFIVFDRSPPSGNGFFYAAKIGV